VNGHYACDGFSRTETVRDALTEAIVARRLSPGARLPEIAIGEVFGVSRTIVREALGRLAGQGLVELKPNRGAFVAAPGAEEGREAFIVRRGLERTVIECLAGRLTQSQIGELQAFVSRETIAAGSEGACGDQFRLLLVKLTGNRTLMRYMAETVSRCALVQARREDPVDVVRVGPTGHTAVVEALIAGDSLTAARLMDEELTASFASPKIARRERPSRASPKKPANIRQIWPPEARQARV
jgi:DNA-binding GntR family transcriptional regulator